MLQTIALLIIIHIVGVICTGICYCIEYKITTIEKLYDKKGLICGETTYAHSEIIPFIVIWEIFVICHISEYITKKTISAVIYIILACTNKILKEKKFTTKEIPTKSNAILGESDNYRQPSPILCSKCHKKVTL